MFSFLFFIRLFFLGQGPSGGGASCRCRPPRRRRRRRKRRRRRRRRERRRRRRSPAGDATTQKPTLCPHRGERGEGMEERVEAESCRFEEKGKAEGRKQARDSPQLDISRSMIFFPTGYIYAFTQRNDSQRRTRLANPYIGRNYGTASTCTSFSSRGENSSNSKKKVLVKQQQISRSCR